MKTTFDDILNRMKQAFYEESGRNPDNLDDIGARLNAVASELYSMYCNLDYIKRQAFLQTASGEYLDYHAQLRDMARKSASKATGYLSFGVTEPCDEDIDINAGTICSVTNKPFLQFVTDEDAVLRAGEISVSVPATALEVGREYGVDANMITVLVNAPAKIETVNNPTRFVGGYDAESDESLRARLLNSFKLLPTGISKQYMIDMIYSIDEIIDCNIYGIDADNKNAIICVKTTIGGLSDEIENKIRNKALALDVLGYTYDIVLAQEYRLQLKVICSAETEVVKNAINRYISQLSIGDAMDLLDLQIWLSQQLGVKVDSVMHLNSTRRYIVCDNNEYFYLYRLEVIDSE